MTISIFDLFSIGIGPSSSHTIGPMRAAKDFLLQLDSSLSNVRHIKITLHGSLAFTGKGHGTDKAICMGLCGEAADTIEPQSIAERVLHIFNNKEISLLGKHKIVFSRDDIIYNYKDKMPHYSNGMHFSATLVSGDTIDKVYYSIGGGFILSKEAIENSETADDVELPYPFSSAAELLALCEKHNLTIDDLMFANEKTWRQAATIKEQLLNIVRVMENSIAKGCRTEGILEGKLKVKRRAPALYQKLIEQGQPGPNHPQAMNWLNVFAMAVNEENAAGGRVVTAPTNGAAGIIPAVLHFYKSFYHDDDSKVTIFLLTAGAIGIIFKNNIAISGAEMGCQGEVGVACSMAAAGLAAVLGGSIYQIENAAEIAMEHNLGLTCDPIGGLVQIPCIERNAMGTVRAVNAAQLALSEEGNNKVSLDAVIKTMREIGKNMNSIYKETSLGGLAVNVTEC